jgi:hypothetical protein
MRESDLVRGIVTAVKKAYPRAYVVKLADRHHRGLPDLIVQCRIVDQYGDYYPYSFFVEVKTTTGRLSKIQKAEHAKIEAAGGTVFIANYPSDVIFFLDRMGAQI